MNSRSHRGWGCVLALAMCSALAAEAPTNALPPLDTVLHGIVQRAEADARIQQEFLARYAFVHTVTRQEHTPKGKLKKRKTETVSHDPTAKNAIPPPSPPPNGSSSRPDRSHARPEAAANEEPLDRPYEREDVVDRRFDAAVRVHAPGTRNMGSLAAVEPRFPTCGSDSPRQGSPRAADQQHGRNPLGG